jgi:hypothetical protein
VAYDVFVCQDTEIDLCVVGISFEKLLELSVLDPSGSLVGGSETINVCKVCQVTANGRGNCISKIRADDTVAEHRCIAERFITVERFSIRVPARFLTKTSRSLDGIDVDEIVLIGICKSVVE